MIKQKIAIDLPSVEKLFADLDPRVVFPQLAKSEAALVAAELALSKRRAEAADLEQRAAALLASDGDRGAVSAQELGTALARRDAGKLLVGSAEQRVAKAREEIARDSDRAQDAILAELQRRAAPLAELDRQLLPVQQHLDALTSAIARRIDQVRSAQLLKAASR